MVSLPWQPQCAHVSGEGDKSEMLLKTHFSLRVKGSLLLYDFNQNWMMSADFNKTPHLNCLKNLSSGGRDVSWKQMGEWTDRRR
jgi:hypothetical protein